MDTKAHSGEDNGTSTCRSPVSGQKLGKRRARRLRKRDFRLRSAAKNHQFVTIVTDPADYPTLLAELEDAGATSLDFRRKCAAKAFAATAAYDSMISQWFGFADQQQLNSTSVGGVPVPAAVQFVPKMIHFE